MTSRDRRPEDGLEDALRAWTQQSDDRLSDACVDTNDLAAFATGQVLDEERERVEAHLATCAACRSAVTAALRANEPGAESTVAPSAARPSSRRPWFAAAAAVVLLAIGLAFLASRPDAPQDVEPTLEVAWASLADAHPGLFEGIEPLSMEERRQSGTTLQRGGLRIEAPRGVVLETHPTFRWTGAGATELRISTADGRSLRSVPDASSPWTWPESPAPLPRGETYLVELTVDGVLGPEQASGTFRVADDALVAEYERRAGAVRESVGATLGDLVMAHVALRANLLAEARRHAEAYVATRPKDAVGRETLFQVLTRAGRADVDHLLEAPR